jgi:hypothetical protein
MELTAAETLPSFSTEELENPPERRIAVLTSGGGPRRAVSSTSLSQTSSREKPFDSDLLRLVQMLAG